MEKFYLHGKTDFKMYGNWVEYSTEEIAAKIGLKGPRTRQILNELIEWGVLAYTAATKNRRYIRLK